MRKIKRLLNLRRKSRNRIFPICFPTINKKTGWHYIKDFPQLEAENKYPQVFICSPNYFKSRNEDYELPQDSELIKGQLGEYGRPNKFNLS